MRSSLLSPPLPFFISHSSPFPFLLRCLPVLLVPHHSPQRLAMAQTIFPAEHPLLLPRIAGRPLRQTSSSPSYLHGRHRRVLRVLDWTTLRVPPVHRLAEAHARCSPSWGRHWVYLGSNRGRKLAHAQMAHDCRLSSLRTPTQGTGPGSNG